MPCWHEGAEVIGVDNFCTGRSSGQPCAPERRKPRFSAGAGDICKPFDFGAVDWHLQLSHRPASPVDYMKLGPETLRVGSDGTRECAGAGDASTARAFCMQSTSECYGDPEQHPQTESYWGNVNPIGPRSVYDEAKRFSEATIMAYHRYYGVHTQHGAHLQHLRSATAAERRPRDLKPDDAGALAGEDLTVYGDGSQTRSFCYVSDLIRGIVALAQSKAMSRCRRTSAIRWSGPSWSALTRFRAGDDRLQQPYRVPPHAEGRPQAAQARYHQGTEAAGMGTEGSRTANRGCRCRWNTSRLVRRNTSDPLIQPSRIQSGRYAG